jgi:hypothetical protein
MPNGIKVGPSVITINQGNMFMVTLDNGEISPDSELGFFAQDTRFVSRYQSASMELLGTLPHPRPLATTERATTSFRPKSKRLLGPFMREKWH